MNKLKQDSIRHCLMLFIIFLTIGIAIILWLTPHIIHMTKGPATWNEVNLNEDIEGIYIRDTLTGIYGPYSEHRTDWFEVTYRYILAIDETHYIDLEISSNDDVFNEDVSTLLLRSLFLFTGMKDLDDAQRLNEHQYAIAGIVTEMSDGQLTRYYEYADSIGLTNTDETQLLPFYLRVGTVSKNHTPFSILLFGSFAFLLIFSGVYALIMSLCGYYQKPLRQYINTSASPEAMRYKIDTFLATAPTLHNLQYNQNFICGYKSGIVSVFGETNELVWIYKYSDDKKLHKQRKCDKHALVFIYKDSSMQTLDINKEEQANVLLELLSQLCPKAIIGFTDELKELQTNNMTAFLNIKYYPFLSQTLE